MADQETIAKAQTVLGMLGVQPGRVHRLPPGGAEKLAAMLHQGTTLLDGTVQLYEQLRACKECDEDDLLSAEKEGGGPEGGLPGV